MIPRERERVGERPPDRGDLAEQLRTRLGDDGARELAERLGRRRVPTAGTGRGGPTISPVLPPPDPPAVLGEVRLPMGGLLEFVTPPRRRGLLGAILAALCGRS